MVPLISAKSTPKEVGIAMCTLEGTWSLIATSLCCNRRLEYKNGHSYCKNCGTKARERGYTDTTTRLNRDAHTLITWVEAWTGFDEVEVSVRF